MEVKGGHSNKIAVCVFEAFGTALLLMAINFSKGDASAIAVGLFAIIMLTANISGAHVNPALTVSVFIREGNTPANVKFAGLIMLS